MKIKRTSNISKKTFYYILAASIILAAGVGLVFALNPTVPVSDSASDPQNTDDVNYQPPTEEQKEAGNEAKENTIDKDPGSNPTPPDSGSQSVGVEITSADPRNNPLQVRTLIQTVNPGTCTLTLSRDGYNTITKSATNQALSSTSTCRGFDIPINNLAKGTWKLTVDFKSSKYNGSVSQNVTIK